MRKPSSPLLAVVALAGVTLVCASPALATVDRPQTTGCVSDTDFQRLGIGQSVGYVRTVAGDDAQVSTRRWTRGVEHYQERLYAMCTPWDEDHATLTTRFMLYEGVWRAIVVDTRVGPEKDPVDLVRD